MSTQHIDEADELASMVCVMSHGKLVVENTPAEIKRKYGVGYSLIVEWNDLDRAQIDTPEGEDFG